MVYHLSASPGQGSVLVVGKGLINRKVGFVRIMEFKNKATECAIMSGSLGIEVNRGVSEQALNFLS